MQLLSKHATGCCQTTEWRWDQTSTVQPEFNDGGPSRCWRVVQIAGKGHGVEATREIVRGERIMREWPLAVCCKLHGARISDASICARINALTPDASAAYYQLSQSAAVHGAVVKTAEGIWRSNAYPKGPPEGRIEQAVYTGICRLNHACRPNTHNAWSVALGQQTIHAVQRIRKGEEITVSYLEPGLEWHQRQQHMLSQFGCACECALCSLPAGRERERSDANQRRIAAIDSVLSGSSEARRAVGTQIIDYVQEKVRLLEAEGMPQVWAHMDMVHAFTRCCVEGDIPAANEWMRRAIKAAKSGLGGDSKVVGDLENILNH